MSDVEVEFEGDYDEEEIPDSGEGETGEGEAEEAKQEAKKKDPLPEGWTTPAQMIHVLKERGICDIKPQQMFGFVKNGKDFPKNEDGSHYFHTDGRYIVPVEETADWVIQHLQKREERAAKRAQKEAEESKTEETTTEQSE